MPRQHNDRLDRVILYLRIVRPRSILSPYGAREKQNQQDQALGQALASIRGIRHRQVALRQT
jgi:hypothetical protein